MPAASTPFLRLPGEDARELWLCDDTGTWRRANSDDGRKGGVFAVESLAMDSAPFWAAAPAETEVDLEMMSALHWEALGVTPDTNARNWLHWRAGADEGRVLTGTMALAPEAAQDEWTSLLPDAFEPSARLKPIPPDECALWKEMGHLVAAFTRGDQLLHVSALNSPVLDAGAAHEVHDLVLALEVRGFLGELRGCRVWTHAEEGFSEALSTLLGLKVRIEAMPPPALPRVSSGLLPASVALKRDENLQRHQFMRLIAAVSLTIVSFFAAWGGWLSLREYRVAKAAAAIRVQEPEVQSVRDAQLRSYALETATDPNLTPVEVFYQIGSLLPSEGIQLEDFSFDRDKLMVIGLASSVNHALKFKADLESHEPLNRYSWNIPYNIVDADNRVRFTAEGTLNGGAPHESE